MQKLRHLYYLFLSCLLLAPIFTFAHEVYVLEPDRVMTLEQLPPVSFIDVIRANLSDTIIWTALIMILAATVFSVSIFAPLEKKFDGYLIKLKHYAPFIARVTAGLAFLMCAYNQALFGPELPLNLMYGQFTTVVVAVMYVVGICMILGLYTRLSGTIGLLLFAVGLFYHGVYMATYLNYFAEMLVLIFIGGHRLSLKDKHITIQTARNLFDGLASKHGELAFLILRVGFGASLIYASVYAKILHNQLAITVVNEYNLVSVFGFNPEFIVLGAALIEIALGIFFILGLEIRFTALVLNIFLTLSLLYFGEAVWPHVILIGIPIAFFCYGYDKYSLEGYFFKKGNREPIF